jgi:hypothetical protein
VQKEGMALDIRQDMTAYEAYGKLATKCKEGLKSLWQKTKTPVKKSEVYLDDPRTKRT